MNESGRRVLVGVDGSAGAQRALAWAARYASLTGAEIVAAHILTYSREFARDLPPTGLSPWRSRLHKELYGPWTQGVREAGVLCRCLLTEHETVDRGLLHVADQQAVELIVLGAHGGSRISHRLLGAVTYKVSHAARRPVVIVPVDWPGPDVTVVASREPRVHESRV